MNRKMAGRLFNHLSQEQRDHLKQELTIKTMSCRLLGKRVVDQDLLDYIKGKLNA